MKKITIACCLFALMASGCIKKDSKNVGEVKGYVPIYVAETTAKEITFSATPKATVHAGKILVLGNRLFQVEAGEGVHVINISNPSSPVKLGFLKVPGCTELSAKNNELFLNNYNDLVVVTGTASFMPGTVSVLKRVANAFPEALNSYPTNRGIYFECPDPSKGIIVGWQEATIKNPKCRR